MIAKGEAGGWGALRSPRIRRLIPDVTSKSPCQLFLFHLFSNEEMIQDPVRRPLLVCPLLASNDRANANAV